MTNKNIELPALGPHDHPEPRTMKWSDVEIAAIKKYALSAIAAHEQARVAGEPVAVLRFERGTPGKENDMPCVVSCNWLPDGEYKVFASPPAPQEAQADSTPLLPVARIRSWTKHGEGHGVLSDGHIDLSVLGVVSGVRQCPTCDGDGWTEEGDPEIGSAKGDCPTCKGAGCLATPSAPTAVEPDERAMANELIKVAAWLLSPEPRRKLAELEDATHIGHRQFHRAYEGTFETLRLKAIEIRNFVDAARASKGTP